MSWKQYEEISRNQQQQPSQQQSMFNQQNSIQQLHFQQHLQQVALHTGNSSFSLHKKDPDPLPPDCFFYLKNEYNMLLKISWVQIDTATETTENYEVQSPN